MEKPRGAPPILGPRNCTDYGGVDDSKFDVFTPMVGVYVALASLACALCIGLDLVRSFRWKKPWVAVKFFPLNAATLTIMAVAIKISTDTSAKMPGLLDQLAKRSGVVLVEGTLESDGTILVKWLNQTRQWIVKGQTKEPTILHDFLRSFSKPSLGFAAATRVYSSMVPEILTKKVANSWSLTLVTLATVIRVAFRNSGQKEAISKVLKATEKGFKYARFTDKNFPVLDGSQIMITAAKKVWDTVDLYDNWMNEDVGQMVDKGDSLAVIKNLEDIAWRCLEKFHTEDPTEEPTDWPLKVIAADCLYKITGTISSTYGPQDNSSVFDMLRTALADTMGACLASLPRAILVHCYSGKFGSREEKVRKAATILGETEGILKWLEEVGRPAKYPSTIIAYVDNWQSSG